MADKKVTVGYSASVKCDLADPKGQKSYEGTTGHFTLTVTEDVPGDVDLIEFANGRWAEYKTHVDHQVEEFYNENSRFAIKEDE